MPSLRLAQLLCTRNGVCFFKVCVSVQFVYHRPATKLATVVGSPNGGTVGHRAIFARTKCTDKKGKKAPTKNVRLSVGGKIRFSCSLLLTHADGIMPTRSLDADGPRSYPRGPTLKQTDTLRHPDSSSCWSRAAPPSAGPYSQPTDCRDPDGRSAPRGPHIPPCAYQSEQTSG